MHRVLTVCRATWLLCPAASILLCLAASAQETVAPVVVEKGNAVWRYHQFRDEPGDAWMQRDYDDRDWASGRAPLGYGVFGLKTQMERASDPDNEALVTFFRHTFELTEARDVQFPGWVGSVAFDDGIVIYINGREVYRRNLPQGELRLTTPSTRAIDQREPNRYWWFIVEDNCFEDGKNVIAARVHQADRTSNDLVFDLDLKRANHRQLGAARTFVNALNSTQQKRQLAERRKRLPRRRFVSLIDGWTRITDATGAHRRRHTDAVQQAMAIQPSTKWARTMAGDTLVKMATQHGVDVTRLALLNRFDDDDRKVGKPFRVPGVICLRWLHDVQPGDTLALLARIYDTDVATLLELNSHLANDPHAPVSSRQILVPGEYRYQYRKEGTSYLRLARYFHEVPRQGVRRPDGLRSRANSDSQDVDSTEHQVLEIELQ